MEERRVLNLKGARLIFSDTGDGGLCLVIDHGGLAGRVLIDAPERQELKVWLDDAGDGEAKTDD